MGLALDHIAERHNEPLQSIPADDPGTYDLICSGDESGIFQLSQEYAWKFIRDMKPRNFDELVHVISLGRPGVSVADKYFAAKAMDEAQYLHPALEPVLSETRGVIIYQEQIMEIAFRLAGFDWSESDMLRKAISKNKMELLVGLEKKFVEGCIDRGVPRKIAEELWRQIHHFGRYGYNKAHAVGYAALTYQTAYLKAHHPVEYLAGVISAKGDDEGERKQSILEARRSGIKVLPPDINASTDKCAIIDNAVCLPLTAVKRVGSTVCNL